MLSWLRQKFSPTATRTDGLRLADELWLGTLAAYPFLETLDPAARGRDRPNAAEVSRAPLVL